MIDPISYFTGAALASGAIEAGKWVAQSAFSGLVGNSFNTAVWRAIPEIQQWYRGEGQPANHHLQRALRTAYLAATGQFLEHARSEASHASKSIDDDTVAWCDQSLEWLKTQSGLLKDEAYRPPAPPDGWEPAHIVDPTAADAAAAIAALRESLSRMLLDEWTSAGLRTPPESVVQALAQGWTEPDRKSDWFELISLYFAQEIKDNAKVQAIFQAATLSKVLIELRQFRKEFEESRSKTIGHPFFAPSAPDYFVGREAVLEVLSARLREPGAVVPLIGMPGLGKTSLAITFAHRRQDDFEGIYWINCAGQSLAASTAELAIQLGIRPEGEPESLLREIRHRCAERHCLLVLDNVESNEIRSLIPDGRCAVLVTTRLAGLPFLAKFRAPELNPFTSEECLDLFKEHLPSADVDSNESEYRRLAERFDRLPIAIAVAAGLLKNDLRYLLRRLLAEAKPHKLGYGDLDTSDLLGKAIASAGEPARRLLSVMAVCAPSGFRLSLAANIAGIEEEPALDALQDLRSRSLVDIVDREKLRCRLHSLIRAVAGQDSILERLHAEAVARRFKSWEESWRDCEEDLDDWRLALDWAADERFPPAERIDLLRTLASDGFLFAYRRGLLTDALRAMETAVVAFEELGDRAGLGTSYGNQAVILKAWGQLEDATALLKKQEAICLELGHRAGLGTSYGNQAVILRAWGRLEDAMALLKKQEAICLELGDRAGLEASYGNQAWILYAWGRLEDAMALRMREEAICLELGDRSGLGTSFGNQAAILQDWGRLEEAMALLKKQEAICLELGYRAGLGDSYGNQALILQDWGRLEEAMALLKKWEAICLELGDRAGLAFSYGNQGLILKDWGRLEEAMGLLKEAEALCRELGLRDGLRISLHNQAELLEEMGQTDEALRLRAESEAIHAELMRGREASA